MDLEKFERQLRILELLVGNSFLSVEEISNRLSLSRRTVYRYISFFKDAGFDVTNENGIYRIELSSPFIKRMTEKVRFSGNEMETMRLLLEQADASNPAVQNLKTRFRNIYGTQFLSDVKVDKRTAYNVGKLYEAMAKKRKVLIRDYSSAHSSSVTNRLVEPFKFVHNDTEIRCYEIESQQCKTFKIARMQGEVEIMNEAWDFTNKHLAYYTDIFGFSGEKQIRIKLRLGKLAVSILKEEYGVEEWQLVIDDDSHWIYSTYICAYEGVGRFVLGLIQDIDIIDSPGLKEYLLRSSDILTKKLV